MKQYKALFSKLLFTLFAFFLVSSCATIAPDAPITELSQIPEIKQPISSIILPLRINLKPFYTQADKSIPNSFKGSDEPCSGVAYSYKFDRDPIALESNGNQFTTDVSGKYWIKMSYCAGCTELFSDKGNCVSPRIPFSCGVGEPMRKMAIQFTSTFQITKNYALATKTVLSKIKPIDPCEVTVFRFDATDKLVKEITKPLADLANEIDKQTSKISFKQDAEKLWSMASHTIPITNIGYLHFNPKTISIVTPTTVNNLLYTTIVVNAQPILNHKPNTAEENPLPELAIIKQIPSDTFDLYLDSELNYDSLSSTLQTYLVGKTIPIKDKILKIDSIHVNGADKNELIIDLKFSGSKKGTMYLRGTPVFNATDQSIYLANVSFDLNTKHVLLKTAKWLFSDKIISSIEKASHQDLKPQLNSVKKQINKSLNFKSNGFDISGVILELNVKHLYLNKDALILRVNAKGKMLITN